jgi:hypothetical protein
MVRAINANSPESFSCNMEGVNALHQGVEIDFIAKPTKNLESQVWFRWATGSGKIMLRVIYTIVRSTR